MSLTTPNLIANPDLFGLSPDATTVFQRLVDQHPDLADALSKFLQQIYLRDTQHIVARMFRRGTDELVVSIVRTIDSSVGPGASFPNTPYQLGEVSVTRTSSTYERLPVHLSIPLQDADQIDFSGEVVHAMHADIASDLRLPTLEGR